MGEGKPLFYAVGENIEGGLFPDGDERPRGRKGVAPNQKEGQLGTWWLVDRDRLDPGEALPSEGRKAPLSDGVAGKGGKSPPLLILKADTRVRFPLGHQKMRSGIECHSFLFSHRHRAETLLPALSALPSTWKHKSFGIQEKAYALDSCGHNI